MLELLDEPLATVRLPLVSVEWLIDTAVRPTVALSHAPGLEVLAGGIASGSRSPQGSKDPSVQAAAPPAKVNGNGSPAIQKGYRKGEKPLSS